MTQSIAHNPFEQVVHKMNPQSRLVRAWPLRGGISAQVTALEIEGADGETQKMVVRQHGEEDRQANPHIAADEFKLLQILQVEGVAAPRPYFVDSSGEIFPEPYVVIEFVEGKPGFPPDAIDASLGQFAAYLARIHKVDGTIPELGFLPEQTQRLSDRLQKAPVGDDLLNEGRIRELLKAAWPLAQRNPAALLHGDYWPGNILWQDGRIMAVIDWEDAVLGDPLADVANARLEILWAYGQAAMEQFTAQYQALSAIDFIDLAYWDLAAALRHAANAPVWSSYETGETVTREGYGVFVEMALEKVGGK
jgi:aminoglycoside phosphotransferase (APT) family kinase protein